MNERTLEQLFRQLAMTLEAGLTPVTFFTDPVYAVPRELAAPIRSGLRSGLGLATSLERLGYLSAAEIAQLRLAEERGRLPDALNRLADTMEAERKSRRGTAMALAYPALILVMAGCLLPLPLAFSDSLTAYIALASVPVSLVAVAATLYFYWLPSLPHTHKARHLPATLLARLPVASSVAQKDGEANFFRGLGGLLEGGMNAVDALESALATSPHPALRAMSARTSSRLESGATLHEALLEEAFFSKRGLQAVAVGERAGILPATLEAHGRLLSEEARRGRLMLLFILGGLAFIVVAIVVAAGVAQVASGYFEAIDDVLKQAQ